MSGKRQAKNEHRRAEAVEQRLAEAHVRGLARWMDRLREQGFRITPRDIRDCEELLTALEMAVVSDVPARHLLEAARERLRLLDSLTTLERDLLRDLEDNDMRVLGPFLDEARQHWQALTKALRAEPPWNLVRPLHHAMRLAWRGLLQLVAGREGASAWVTLFGVWPELLSNDLEGETGAATKALQSGIPRLEPGDLLSRRRFGRLAELLAAKSRGEKDGQRLAGLWDVELWAWHQAARTNPGDGEVVKTALARVEELTSETAGRIPSERRIEVIRRLRQKVLGLCEIDDYSRHFLGAATALLRWLDDDPALLAVALASAVCTRKDRDRDRFTERIAARGVASREDRDDVLNVIANLTKEEWRDIVEGLPRLHPLLEKEDWDEAIRLASDGIAQDVLAELSCGWGQADLERLRLALESARRALPDVAALPTLELAVLALAAGEQAPGLVRRYLAESPTLEDALLLFRVLVMSDPLEPGMFDAIAEARAVVIARLDLRWSVWRRELSLLLDEASLEEIRSAKARLQALLETESLDTVDRTILQDSLADVTDLGEEALVREGAVIEIQKAPGELDEETWDESDDWENEEGWDEDEEEDEALDLPVPEQNPYEKEESRVKSLLERLFPPPQLVMKPLGPAPGPLQEKDLEPLLRPLRRQAVEEVLRAGGRRRVGRRGDLD